MDYTLDLGAWNSVFAVPCALVDRHIKLAGKEQLQAILWILRHAGETFCPEDLAAALGITLDQSLDALEYWQERGLLAEKDRTLHPVPQREAARRPARTPDSPPNPDPPSGSASQNAASLSSQPAPPQRETALPPKRRLAKPDAAYLAKRAGESAAIRSLFQEAEATLGILSPAMTAVLLASCDDYGLPVEVVVMLIHYAKEVGKTNTAYIESVARDWAESGVFSLEAAEAKLQELSEKRLAWGQVSSAAGLPKRSPSKKEEEAAFRWVREWSFSRDMLAAAYERCVDNTGKFSVAYMNRVLERWHREGIQNLEQLAQAERKKAAGKKPGTSYDIDELEQLSHFDLPEEL